MSVIFGVFYRNGKPVSDELERMYSGMKHAPHEKWGQSVHGNCGFGHMLTYNTPEAVHEVMPKWLDEQKLLFAAEGRIDNRDDLFSALGVPSGDRPNMPDGDLILRAYLKWGEKCVDRLAGKWSLSAFHADSQKLFIARDKWDYSNVSYYSDDEVFAFCTVSCGLEALPFVGRRLDEMKIARLLVILLDDFSKTYHPDVRRLLPSHCMQVSRENLSVSRYWNFEDVPVREGLKLEDYVEDLFASFEAATRARLRSCKPVGATLSGGMDSGSVCAVAAGILAGQGRRLKTFSHVPLFQPSITVAPSSFGNERPFIEANVKFSGNMDPVYLDSAGVSPIMGIREGIRLIGEPFHGAGNAYWISDIFMTAAREGFGTVLMGEFGNGTISWKGVEASMSAHDILTEFGYWRFVKKRLLKPVLFGQNPLGRAYKRICYGRNPWHAHSFIAKEFEESIGIRDEARKSRRDLTFKYYFNDPKVAQRLVFDMNILRLPYGANLGFETGVELRDPTGDTRVIESALSIPDRMFFGDMNRWVLRTMMKGRLPDAVRLNQKKGKQSSDIVERLYANRAEMDRILADMDASGFSRITDTAKIRSNWEQLKSDREHFPIDRALHMLRPVSAFCYWRGFNN